MRHANRRALNRLHFQRGTGTWADLFKILPRELYRYTTALLHSYVRFACLSQLLANGLACTHGYQEQTCFCDP